jgi:hypothetical protein
MPPKCTICIHKKRNEIDQAIVGGESLSGIARSFRVSEDALDRHKRKHISKTLVAAKQAKETLRADNLLDQLTEIFQDTREILDRAKSRKDDKMALNAVTVMQKNIVTLLQAQGELPDTQVNVQVVVQQVREKYDMEFEVIREVFDELGPEVRAKIARRIKERCPELAQ